MSQTPENIQTRSSMWRFFAYVRDYRALLALAIFAGFGKFALNYTFPWLIGSAIDHVIQPLNPATWEERTQWLWLLIGLGVVLSIAHAISHFARGHLSAKLGNRIIRDLRQDLFDHLHRLSLHFYAKERTGSIVSRIITDIQTASQIINGGLLNLALDVFNLAIGLWLIFGINWKLALATLAIMPLYGVLFRKLNPRVKTASARVQSQISMISGNVQERLAGIALVKTYAAEKREAERFREDTEEHLDRVMTQSNLSQLVSACSEGLIHIGQTIVIGYGGWLAITGEITAGEVVKFLGYLAVMYLPVRRFAEINVIWQTSLSAIDRVFEVFDITPKIVEKPDAPRVSPSRGEVRFENVSFDYDDDSDETRIQLEETARDLPPPKPRNHPVLANIVLNVAPGERIALVGPSGSGKTTLVSLLPRLYDVKAGRLVIDGLDVRDYRLRKLRKAIGIVQQDSFLFSGSIRENIAYGRPDATDEQILAATRAANAHEFIERLPDGYDSRMGERGVALSGGQRQRVSIARAILKDPRILILDEATSALDSQSESLVQQALERLMQDRTCLIIAHRLSTVRNADRIVVLEAGHIVEIGNHVDLLARGGLYAKLVRQQFGNAGDVDPAADARNWKPTHGIVAP
ncbi:MAG TPA: ABC transporter ATP-binding protein [Tepidisphaeraceae bacterium]|jgi:subfamily B ATP-binding cassette protein MsbA|nr:ABC transporter ATP-binding protein [Tepidisphaeraceae bacterium]